MTCLVFVFAALPILAEEPPKGEATAPAGHVIF